MKIKKWTEVVPGDFVSYYDSITTFISMYPTSKISRTGIVLSNQLSKRSSYGFKISILEQSDGKVFISKFDDNIRNGHIDKAYRIYRNGNRIK